MSNTAFRWTLHQMPRVTGCRFFITGANSGIGYAAALELARRGASVILACRDPKRGEDALARLRREATGPDSAASEAELVILDLASLDSIRRVAADEVNRSRPMYGLINNAGILGTPKRRETADGFELQFGTNVLGTFALTCGMMPALEHGRASMVEDAPRVITVASIAHKRGRINFEDLNATRSYSPMGSYAQSKLADLMFAFELERRLRSHRLGAISIAVHPGVARSSIFKVGSGKGLAGLAERVFAAGIGTFLNSEVGGAVPTLFAATSPEALGGHYYGSQGFNEMRGNDAGPANVAPQALDRDAQRRLWEVCEQMTGCHL